MRTLLSRGYVIQWEVPMQVSNIMTRQVILVVPESMPRSS